MLIFFSLYWSKLIEWEKEREKIRTLYEYVKENCQKVVTK